MVLGDLADAAVGDAVAPAVTHIDNGGLIFSNQRRHQGGAHALKFLELIGLVVNRKIGQLDGAAQNHIGLIPVRIVGPAALDLLDEYVHRQGAGHIAGFCAAHAVANHAQQSAPPQFFNMKRVLVLFSDAPNICQAPALHGKHLSL